jgi:uncharacterized membrane protein/mono/diheme cytochrome c family protein
VLKNIFEFIGRFHPLLVHLPIGILIIGLLFHWLAAKDKYAYLKPAVPFLLLAGSITAIFSCITGYVLSLNGDYESSSVDWHMWFGIAVAVISFLFYLQYSMLKKIWVRNAISIILLMLIGYTGHLGGSLTHGEDYLTAAWNKEQTAFMPKVIPDVQQAQAYNDIIQPILQQKCYSCHGPNKQKGKLRMDSQEFLLSGGKGGKVIHSNNPEESELIKRLLLPEDDKHHMAPKGKLQVTDQQINLIQWWIKEGADFRKKVSELNQPENIKPLLMALQTVDKQQQVPVAVPDEPVEKADDKIIQQLKEAGVVVIPVAQNSNYLSVNFVTATHLGDDDISLLSSLKKQLIWLKIGSTQLTDKGLKTIAQCTNLTQLQLNDTKITNEGLASLSSLVNLQSLNLTGTKVDAAGLTPLKNLKKLHTIYLYQTQVDQKDWNMLKAAFPTTQLDTGGYHHLTQLKDTVSLE